MADLLEQRLGAYIACKSREPYAFGRNDCVMFICDWARRETGRDPLGPWRGTWRSGPGASENLALCGGLKAALRQQFSRAGFVETATPQIGDVALVDPAHPYCAIRVSGGWAQRLRRGGVMVRRAEIIVAWCVSSEDLTSHG